MAMLSCLLLCSVMFTGSNVTDNSTPRSNYIGMDVMPEIEVHAPRHLTGEIDSLNMVQGIVVFGEKEEMSGQRYRQYRRTFFNISSMISEYAVYAIAAIVSVTFGTIGMVKLIRTCHIHLVHQHKHTQLHEYYLWRKANLDKNEQERLTRRT